MKVFFLAWPMLLLPAAGAMAAEAANEAPLGADLVADAVAGLNEYPVPFIVIDMGTATTVSVVNSKKQYISFRCYKENYKLNKK